MASKRDIKRVLKDTFGFGKFKPNQREVVEAILDNQDVFVSMPTGGGKSLCYQLSALLLDSVAVVVSPLIALMHDQVEAAKELGIPAEYLNSSLEQEEARAVYRRIFSGEVKLLYISPERFALPRFRELLEQLEPQLFVIDEAHCISEWGHDFRPDYLALGSIRRDFPEARIAAFTATATMQVQQDILDKLHMKNPFILRASFDRPELFYRVKRKESPLDQILAFVMDRPGQAGIIYRSRRKDVEETSEFLSSHGIRALPYHAGLADRLRKKHQEMFVRDEVDVIVATIAFGMGIDKSNVRFVIHGDLPKSLEAYYQETGRAGRDGLLSHCLLLYSPGDIRKIRYFIDQVDDAEEAARGRQSLDIMVRYAEAGICRRKILLEHFDETHPGDCGGCDICTDVSQTEDMSVDAQKLLSAVARTEERFGSGHIIDIVKGANTEKIRQWDHDNLPTYGVGKGKPKKHWSRLVSDLLNSGALEQQGGRFPTLALTSVGRDILFGRKPFMVVRRQEKRAKSILVKKGAPGNASASGASSASVAPASPGAAGSSDAAGRGAASAGRTGPGAYGSSGPTAADEMREEARLELFEELRRKRLEISRAKKIAPYMVFSDATLAEIAEQQPGSKEEFLAVSGVGRKKLKKYGDEFLELIRSFNSNL